uniref:Ig-like domain-containing protein n=1 Tax=Leptobrachium leishanense TaxID=445787 RepID=A0A8C5QKI8_9ANUR
MLGASRCRRISGVLLAMLTASLLIRSGQLQVSVRVIGEVTAVQGRDVTLTCNVETKEDVSQLTWQKKMDPNNENLLTYRAGREPTYLTPFAQDRIRILGKGTFDVGDILIRDVRLSDEGTYVCGFSTHPSGIQEREIKLQVHVPPTVSIYLPPIPVQVLPRNVAECTAAAAKPPAFITWVCSSLPYNVNTTDIVHQNKTVTRTSRLWMIPTRSLSGQNATCLVLPTRGGPTGGELHLGQYSV